MLNFLAGCACGVLAMMIAIGYVTRPPKRTSTFIESYGKTKRLKRSHIHKGVEYPWPASKDFAEFFSDDTTAKGTPPE